MEKDDDKPTLEELREALRRPLSDALAAESPPLGIETLCEPKDVADDPVKLLITDAESRKVAVVLVSSPADPDIVRRGMRIAAEAKTALGERLGSGILAPLGEGALNGLSYAILPFRRPLCAGRIARRVWRVVLRSRVLDWLAEVNAATVVETSDSEVVDAFERPLAHAAMLEILDDRLRRAASEALERLQRGDWNPRFVLMHGDLWEGNLLLAPRSLADAARGRSRLFVVIDWPGAKLRGYPMVDLVRLAASMRLRAGGLRREALRHCEILGTEPANAIGYLLAGLGHLGQNLGCFPPETYAAMSRVCFDDLSHALA